MRRFVHGAVLDNRYRVERVLAGGGMGLVLLATHLTLERTVAIKLLHPRGLASQHAVARFVREAQTAARLESDHLVRVLDAATLQTGEPYLVMEHLLGHDARTLLQARGRIDALAAADIVVQACMGVGAAHSASIVHRDLKPANLFLVDANSRDELAPFFVKVLDFGVSKAPTPEVEADEAALTQSRSLLGTPIYMSPEQIRASRDAGPPADVWALGSILYELLAGEAPYRRASLGETLSAILTEEPKSLGLIRPDLPGDLCDVAMRCLVKGASKRFPDAFELAHALEPYVSSATRDELRALLDPRPPPSVRGRGSVALNAPRVHSMMLVGDGPGPSRGRDLRRVAASFGGTVEELPGGAAIVTFAATEVADHATRAVRCALAFRAELAVRSIAIVTGRGQASSRSPDLEIVGRARMLLESNDDDPIRLDEVTARLVETMFDVHCGTQGWSLRGPRDAAVVRTLLGKSTPLIGREREIDHLESFLDECASEPVARAILVTAPPQYGKSRLCQELLARARHRADVEIWTAQGDPMSAGAPYSMIAPALERSADLVEGEPIDARRRKLGERVERLRARAGWDELDALRITEFLGELVGAPFPDDQSVQLRTARREPVVRGDQIRRAFEDFVGAECATRLLLVVLDDLQWADQPSIRLLDAVLRLHRDRSLMVVAFGRPETHDLLPRLWQERGVQEIRLAALTRRASERLVRHVLEDVSPSVAAEIVLRAEGNPFYLEELIRAAADGRDTLPETLAAVLQARLEALDADSLRLLQAGSVFGHVFRKGGVAGFGSPSDVDRSLDDLVAREVVAEQHSAASPGDRVFRFRHALLREAAYSMLGEAERADAHRMAADWLESIGESDAAVLAEHCDRAAAPARARAHYRRAAEQALGANDFSAAIEHADRAIDRGAAGEERGALQLIAAEAERWRGDWIAAETRSFEAFELLPRASTSWCQAAVEAALASARRGNHERLLAIAREVDECAPIMARISPQRPVGIVAIMRLAASLAYYGYFDLADALIRRSECPVAESALREPAIAARWYQLSAERAVATGDLGERRRCSGLAAAKFREAGDLRSACAVSVPVAYYDLMLGDNQRAIDALLHAIADAERMGLGSVVASAKHNLGFALARIGRIGEGVAVEREALAASAAQGDRSLEGAAHLYLAWIHMRASEYEGAEREAEHALLLVSPIPPLRAYALSMLADSRLRRGAAVEALEIAARAREIVDGLGNREDCEAQVLLVHAEALRAAGRDSDARAAILDARARVHVAASRIANDALRASFLAEVPENARIMTLAREWDQVPL
ncbi:MAG: protein kinase [Deltaproteobacteria bacterium]|nr:protein kinase [Deltaproteobacteria bacterium]